MTHVTFDVLVRVCRCRSSLATLPNAIAARTAPPTDAHRSVREPPVATRWSEVPRCTWSARRRKPAADAAA